MSSLPRAALNGQFMQLDHPISAKMKLEALLSVSAFYLNKPLELDDDLSKAIDLAQQGVVLSEKLNDQKSLDTALLIGGYAKLASGHFAEAEKDLPRLNGRARLKYLLTLSYYYTSRGRKEKFRYERALNYALQALHLSKELKETYYELLAEKDIAVARAGLRSATAEKDLLALLTKYRSVNKDRLHYPYFYLADYYHDHDQTDNAAHYSLLALESMKRTGDMNIAGDVFLLHSIICTRNGKFEDALNYGRQAIAGYRHHPGMVKLSSPFITVEINRAYQKLGRHREALTYMQDMQRLYPPKDLADSMSYYSMIGHGYRELKQYDKAVPYFAKFKALSDLSGIQQYNANSNFAQLYVESKHYDKSLPYLSRALKEQRTLSLGSRLHLNYMAYLADSATGNYLGALHHMSYLNDQAESRKRIETDKALKRWDVAYGTHKREELLALRDQNIKLLDQRSRAQQEKIRRSELIRDLSAGVVVLLLIILILAIYQYRQKTRNNELLLVKSNLINEKNVMLEKLVAEKEWLLKEVHHRVKNNLHTIFCLLESQAVFLQDDALAAVETSRNRIYAMSLLHQKLYQSDNIKVVDMALYFNEFLVYLRRSFDLEERNIRIDLDIAPLQFDVSIAIPLGLILNEAVTNAIKYAFEGRAQGLISVELEREGQKVAFSIKDDGIGYDVKGSSGNNTLGMELMRGLSLDIGANIDFIIDHGTGIYITFMVDEHSGIAETDRKLA